MSHKLVIKDAVWQLLGRLLSAVAGFLVVKIMSPYLGPLRFGDYSTLLKYFAIWSALADFGLYVLAVRTMGRLKEHLPEKLEEEYGKFIGARLVNILVVYVIALLISYLLPAYTSNPYILWGLPVAMIFSATFMAAGIIQLPLQIFWKMKHLSIGLILARINQIITLALIVFFIFPGVEFDGSVFSRWVFLATIGTVLVSAFTQFIYVLRQANRLLKIKIIISWSFIKKEILSNRRYGIAYYFSSFHTLAVLILLSNFFPSSQGYIYTGIWALALTLMEIFLIIPSALGNSLLHKIANYNTAQKRTSFGNLLQLVWWIASVIMFNMFLFGTTIVKFVGSEEFLGSSRSNIGSNHILPFLGIVLLLSFCKQVYNYIFVAEEKQHVLLGINVFGVVIGLSIGLYAIPVYGILGGIVTQLILEIMFVLGSLWVAYRHNLMPIINKKFFVSMISILSIACVLAWNYSFYNQYSVWEFLLYAMFINLILLALSWNLLKKFAKGLTVQEGFDEL